MKRIKTAFILFLFFSISYGFQNPDKDGQTVEAYGGVGVYGITACETLSIYDYRVASVQYKKRWDRWQVGGAAIYMNRVERYEIDTKTGKGVPMEDREVDNYGGLMASGSYLHKNIELTLGIGFLAEKDGVLPWPHATLRLGSMDAAYIAFSFADPRPPYNGFKAWVGGYPIPELHIYAGMGTFFPVMASPFFGVDWRIKELFALSLSMGYHMPFGDDKGYTDFDTSIFGSLGVTFYF